MSRLVFILICCYFIISTVSAFSLQENTPSVPLIKLDSTNLLYDLGGVKKNSVVTMIMRIQNKLDRALNIREARSSCGCVKVELAPQRLKRNGIAELAITLDTVGFKDETESTIYILTDDIKYELISLKIILHIVE